MRTPAEPADRVDLERVDTVVVGAGSCGCTVAARLSRDPGRTVLLVEAGPDHRPAGLDSAIVMPVGPGSVRADAVPASYGPSSEVVVRRGRGIGGSGAVNGGYFARATRADLARWPASWHADVVAPWFDAVATDLDRMGSARAGHGPIPVVRVPSSRRHPVTDAFVRAALASGATWIDDLDDPTLVDDDPPGGLVAAVPLNVTDGRRRGPDTMLPPPTGTGRGLVVWADAPVDSVIVESGRARGVRVVRGGRPVEVRARQVVLTAGAVHTSRILARSGIGPAGLLARAGVPVTVDNPAVGDGGSDHPELAIGYRARGPRPTPAAVLEAVLHRDGLEFRPYTAPFAESIPGSGAVDPVLTAALRTPRTRTGSILTDRLDVRIDYPVLCEPSDRAALVHGAHEAAALLAATPATAAEVERVPDDPDDAWLAAHLGPTAHLCGTAAMGRVVDERCRVLGVESLTIADTSVFPSVPSRGPHATAVMLAHRVASGL